MLKKDQNQLFEEIYHLQNCELAMGEYYQCLADAMPDERMFWIEAISDEVNHARVIGKIIGKISLTPSKYNLGKFRVAVIETFLNGVYQQIEFIRQNKLAKAEILKIAFDYESSLLMSRPYDIVESTDPEYRAIKEKLAQDVNAHSQKIKSYIKAKLDVPEMAAKVQIQDIGPPVTDKFQ